MEILQQHPALSIAEVAELTGIKAEELRDRQVQFLRTSTKIKQLIHER